MFRRLHLCRFNALRYSAHDCCCRRQRYRMGECHVDIRCRATCVITLPPGIPLALGCDSFACAASDLTGHISASGQGRQRCGLALPTSASCYSRLKARYFQARGLRRAEYFECTLRRCSSLRINKLGFGLRRAHPRGGFNGLSMSAPGQGRQSPTPRTSPEETWS